MLVCLATFKDRMATLLERAAEFRMFEFHGRLWVAKGFTPRSGEGLAGALRLLADVGVEILICGGMSRQNKVAVDSLGLAVVPWVCGTCSKVLKAVAKGDLSHCIMPGCRVEPPGPGVWFGPGRGAAREASAGARQTRARVLG